MTQLETAAYIERLRSGDRAFLAQAITAAESSRRDVREPIEQVLDALMTDAASTNVRSTRLGISGPPGAGKSTFINAYGAWLLDNTDRRIAVLTIDPSSSRTGGSILGDKTRMDRLVTSDRVFVRPSPSSGSLGGAHTTTADSISLCEAAGYDFIIVETVGVGQSELQVADLVDVVAVVLSPSAGDELQSIKRGLLEIADAVIVSKHDGDTIRAADETVSNYRSGLQLLFGSQNTPPVVAVSSVEANGVDAAATALSQLFESRPGSDAWTGRRARQRVTFLHEVLRQRVLAALQQTTITDADLDSVRGGAGVYALATKILEHK